MYNSLWYQALNKSPLTPSNLLFSIVWPILYILMGLAVYFFIKNGLNNEKKITLLIFFTQLILNLLWPPTFFMAQKIILAEGIILTLIILVFVNIIRFYKYSKISGILLIPYWLWLIFAGYLNYEIIKLNIPG